MASIGGDQFGMLFAEGNSSSAKETWSDLILPQPMAQELLENKVMENYSLHYDMSAYDILRQPAWRGIILALYISVILIGIAGNTIVVYVVARNKNMQNVTNIFIANLALSDIGLCIFSLPIQLHYQLTDQWIFGETLCRLVFAAFAMPMHVSALTILLIAFDRYWLIIYPLRQRMSVQMAFVLIICSVILSSLLSIPVTVFVKVVPIEEPKLNFYRIFCTESWPSDTVRFIYSLLMFLFQFCLPLLMTAILYYRIYCRLRQRPTTRITIHERKQKTNKILIAIVTLFIICWLPWNLFSLITEMARSIVSGPHFKFVDLLLKVFAMGSACVNPFLYCWLNENFRKEIDSMAFRLRIYKQPSLPQSVPTYNVEQPEDGGNTGVNLEFGCTQATERTSMIPSSVTPNSTPNNNNSPVLLDNTTGSYGNRLTVTECHRELGDRMMVTHVKHDEGPCNGSVV